MGQTLSRILILLAWSALAKGQLLAPLFTTTPSAAGPTITAGTAADAWTTLTTLSATISCASGNMAVMWVSTTSALSMTPSDSAANAGWTATTQQTGAFSNIYVQFFYNTSLGSSVTSVKVTFTSTNVGISVLPACVSGLNAYDSGVYIGSYVVNATAVTSGTYSTANASEIACMFQRNSSQSSFTATGPAAPLFNDVTYPGGSVSCTTYSTTKSSVTQAGTLAAASYGDTLTVGI